MSKRAGLIILAVVGLGVLISLGVIVLLTLHAFGCAILFGLPREC